LRALDEGALIGENFSEVSLYNSLEERYSGTLTRKKKRKRSESVTA
jgi:hypothetical protein